MPKEPFSSMAANARLSNPTGAFLRGAAGDSMNRNTTFAMLNDRWQLAPAAKPRDEQKADSEEPLTLAEVLAWLSGTPKGGEDAYDLKQEIMRNDVHLPQRQNTLPFMASDSEFQHIMKAEFESHRLIEEANTTALTSATWYHQMMLLEYLQRRQMRASFANNLVPRQGANVYTPVALSGTQQIRAYCKSALHAPALRKA